MPAVKLLSQQLVNDTGNSATDGITSDGAVTLNGTVTGAQSVMIYDNGVKLGAAKVAADGTWTFAFTLAEGYHTLYAMASDVTGKSAYSNVGQNITVETKAPVIKVTSQTLTNDTGAKDNISTDGRVQLAGTVSEYYAGALGTPGTQVQIFDGTKLLGNATVYTDNTWFFAATLSQGTHSLHAVASDLAGNSTSTGTGATIQIVPASQTTSASSTTKSTPVSGVVTTTMADDSVLAKTYANGVLTQEATTFASGSADLSETKLYTSTMTRDTVVHADKSRDITLTLASGQAYTIEHDVYDPSGVLTQSTRSRADDTLVSSYVRAADGTKTTSRFDLSGTLLSSTVVKTDGSSFSQTFADGHLIADALTHASGASDLSDKKQYKNGILANETITHADKTVDRYSYGVTGQVIDHDIFNASGKLALRDVTNSDGSHKTAVYDAGRTLTSTATVVDTFVNAGPGGTTFAFALASGHDTITGFHAGSGSATDVIHIDESIAANFAALQSHMSSSGTGTMITFDAKDSVLIKNVGMVALSAQNFSFG